MSEATTLIGTTLVCEAVDFWSLCSSDNATLNGCALQLFGGGQDCGTVNDENGSERNLDTIFDMKKLKLDLLALRYLLLLSTGCDHCVHSGFLPYLPLGGSDTAQGDRFSGKSGPAGLSLTSREG